MSFIAVAASSTADAPIVTHPFFPSIQPDDFRATMQVDGTVTVTRCVFALTDAAFSVNRELAKWRMAHEGEGRLTLSAAEGETPGRLAHLYRRAVYSIAKADLMERMRSFDTTASGQKRAESDDPTIDDHRRNARWAIRDLLSCSRSTVELI